MAIFNSYVKLPEGTKKNTNCCWRIAAHLLVALQFNLVLQRLTGCGMNLVSDGPQNLESS